MECKHFLFCILAFCSNKVASYPQVEAQGAYLQSEWQIHNPGRHLPSSGRLNDQTPPQQQRSGGYQRPEQQYYTKDYQSLPQQYQNDNYAKHTSANIIQQHSLQDPTPFVNPPRRNYNDYGYEPQGYQYPTLQPIHSIPNYEGSYQDYQPEIWAQNPNQALAYTHPMPPRYPFYGLPYDVPHVPIYNGLNNHYSYPVNVLVKPYRIDSFDDALAGSVEANKHLLDQATAEVPSLERDAAMRTRDRINKIMFRNSSLQTSNDKPRDAIVKESTTKRPQTYFYNPGETPTADAGKEVSQEDPEWRPNNGNYANYDPPRKPVFRTEVYPRQQPVVNELYYVNHFKPQYAPPIEPNPVAKSNSNIEVSENKDNFSDPKELQINEKLNTEEQQYEYSEEPTTTENPDIVQETNEEGKYYEKFNKFDDMVPPKDESKITLNPVTNVYVDATTDSQLDEQNPNDYNGLNEDKNITKDYQNSLINVENDLQDREPANSNHVNEYNYDDPSDVSGTQEAKDESKITLNPVTNVYVDATTDSQLDEQNPNDYNGLNEDKNITKDYQNSLINVENDLQDREPANSNHVNEYNYDDPSDVSGTQEAITRDYNESANTEKLNWDSDNKVLETSTVSLETYSTNNLNYEKEIIANNTSIYNSTDKDNVEGYDKKVLETSTVSLANLITDNLNNEKEIIVNSSSFSHSTDDDYLGGDGVTGSPKHTLYNESTTAKPKNTSEYVEIDVANLKNDDGSIVWFRPDPDFWNKVTQGNGTYDVAYFMNVNPQPVIERHMTSFYYENGTEVEETVEIHWEHDGDPDPIEVKTTRKERHPEHPDYS